MDVFASIQPQGTRPLPQHQLTWADAPAQQAWKPLIEQMVAAKPFLFARAIQTGLYPCALLRVAAWQMVTLRQRLEAEYGLGLLTLDDANQPPAANSRSLIVIGFSEPLTLFQSAWRSRHSAVLFNLLQIPYCCRHFHDKRTSRQAAGQAAADILQAKVHNTPTARTRQGITTVTALPSLNSLVNWLDIQLLSHEPCSLQCRPSAILAQNWLRLGQAADLDHKLSALQTLLAWPATWQQTATHLRIALPILTLTAAVKASSDPATIRFLHEDAHQGNGGLGDETLLGSSNGKNLRFGHDHPPPRP